MVYCKILEDLKRGCSVNLIKARYGVSGSYVYLIAKKENIPFVKGVNLTEPISPKHLWIGQKIIAQRVFELNLDITQSAHLCGIPITRMSKIEAGIFDITLTDILKIEEGLNIKILKD